MPRDQGTQQRQYALQDGLIRYDLKAWECIKQAVKAQVCAVL